MFKRKIFDPRLPYRVALYLRMSSTLQNERSPMQQRAEIERRLKALGYTWVIVEVYCDEAKSGRFLRKRADYQRMLRDIITGKLVIDLILVDMLERFGRVDDLPTIRKQLFEKFGVLVLTADTNFTDPTSPGGKALGMVESIRASEHGRGLAHNVLRGKRDAAELKHWPGGAPPFGLLLKSIMKTLHGREEVDYCILIPDPRTSWIIVLLFNQAARTAWGTTRLAKFLTNHADIPDEYKPFQPSTVGYWLDQEIYFGMLVWGENSTSIVDDRRVIEPNSDGEILRVPDFCEGLISRALWEEVQRIRQPRRDRAAAVRALKKAVSDKYILAPAAGMTVNYMLSGLVFCAECGLRMIVGSPTPYTTKSGEVKRYTSYSCAGYRAGHCRNNVFVPEEWLRGVVLERLRQRLFPWES